MIALPKTPLVSRMSTIEFLAWPADPTGRTWQLVNGEPVAMAPASPTHGAILGEIASLLRNHLRANAPTCRIIVEPGVTPRVRADMNVRIPDLAVTCSMPSLRERLLPDPILCVEILPPSNEPETWANLWAYTTMPSVQQILVVQSLMVEAELLRRQSDGTWPANSTRLTGHAALVELDSIGATFALGEFYDTTELAVPRND